MPLRDTLIQNFSVLIRVSFVANSIQAYRSSALVQRFLRGLQNLNYPLPIQDIAPGLRAIAYTVYEVLAFQLQRLYHLDIRNPDINYSDE